MKKTIIAMLSIVLMLFAFASCSNDSGNPPFEGDRQEVANQLKPADLVKEVLEGNADGVDVEYELIPQASAVSGSRALDAGNYILRATVTFKSYATDAGTIIRGVLVYDMPGRVNASGSFTAGGTCSITTETELVVETESGDEVPVTITDDSATVRVSVMIASDNTVTNVNVTVTVSDNINATVADEPVDVPDETPIRPEPTPDPVPEGEAISTSDEFLAAISEGGTYYLTDDLPVESTGVITISNPFTLDLNDNSLTLYSQINVRGAAVEISNGVLLSTDTSLNPDNSNIELYEGAALTLDGVEYTANCVNIFCVNNENNVTVNIRNNSVIKTTGGYYAIGTNASKVESQNVIMNISTSTVTSVGSVNDYPGDNTAILFNVRGETNITNSTITGDKQAMIARGGTHTFTDTIFEATGNHSYPDTYKDGEWGGGNNVPFAALVIGNRVSATSTSYPYGTDVIFDNVTANAPTDKEYYGVYVYENKESEPVVVTGNITINAYTSVNEEKGGASYLETTGDSETENPSSAPELKGNFADFVALKERDDSFAAGQLLSMVINIAVQELDSNMEEGETYELEGATLDTGEAVTYWGSVTIDGPVTGDSFPPMTCDGVIAYGDDFVFDIEGSMSESSVKINGMTYTFDPAELG